MPRGQLDETLRYLRRVTGLSAAQGLTDARLLERYVSGQDQEAFASLVYRYGRLVRSVCRHVLHHEQDIDDAFQVAFLVLASKAASIRKTTSVASWLYGVAYRTAMNAKRARTRRSKEQGNASVEARSGEIGTTREEPVAAAALREIQAILDDEVNHLPEKYRTPFVLCCLDGKSKAETARELGWKEGTVSSRVARARKELQQRLTRRGVMLSAALCAIEVSRTGATAAVHPALVNCTIKAALSFAAGKAVAADLMSAKVAALAKGVLQSMFMTKLKIATGLLLAVSVAIGGLGVLGHTALAASQADDKQSQAQKQEIRNHGQPDGNTDANAGKGITGNGRKAVAPPKDDAADSVSVRGRVLDPDGKPFEGAKLYLWTNAFKTKANLPVRATTGKDGRFRFTATQGDVEGEGVLIAFAKGYGPDWIELGKAVKKGDKATLRLARDDVPINGRIVDQETRPIPGVTVEVHHIEKPSNDGDLKARIEIQRQLARGDITGSAKVIAEGIPTEYLGTEVLPLPTSVKTDANGRFRLTGFGRERVLHLKIHGKNIENTLIEVLTRTDKLTDQLAGVQTFNENAATYGATFERVVGPSKPIIGTVRDNRTGKPLAGMHVYSKNSGLGRTLSETTTDDQGRYRIDGTSKRDNYTVVAGGWPYFNNIQTDIPDTPGFEPLAVDLELDRGIELSVRLTDKATGKPVRGSVSYIALAGNRHVNDFPSLRYSGHGGTKNVSDGSFQVLAIPGPGRLLIQGGDANRFVPAEDSWEVLPMASGGSLMAGQVLRVVTLDLSEKDPKPLSYDIALEPGQTRTGTVVGPDGQPLAGAHVAGRTPLLIAIDTVPEYFSTRNLLKAASFTAFGLSTHRARNLVFYHRQKQLGKVQPVRGDDTGPLTVRLEPLGSTKGRLLDANEKPWAGLKVHAGQAGFARPQGMPTWEFGQGMGPMLAVTATTDRHGRFQLDGLLPGLKYNLSFSEGAYSLDGLSVESGKTKDLGDLKSKLVPGKAAKEGNNAR
jgi:RNA polymerase sigma factor (sigma-70 family)